VVPKTDISFSPAHRRHATFVARLQSAAPNSSTAVLAAEAAVRGFRFNETTARDLISTIWNILDRNLDDTAGIINAVVDLFDEEDKKSSLLASWNGFKIEVFCRFLCFISRWI